MSFPFFSVVYIGILSYIFFKGKKIRRIYYDNVFLLFFFEIINNQGYFIKLGTQEYTINVIQSYLVCMLSVLFLIIKNDLKSEKRIFFALIVFLSITLISFIYKGYFPYDGYILPDNLVDMGYSWDSYVAGNSMLYKYKFDLLENLNTYRKICIYAFIIYTIKTNMSSDDVYHILNRLIKWGNFIVFYGYIEMILKNVLNMPMEAYNFNEFIFGASDSTYTWNNATTLADGFYRLQGVTREPSSYVLSLLIFGILILISIKYHKLSNLTMSHWHYIELGFIFVMMPLTGGMSSLWCMFSLLLSYAIININRNINWSKVAKLVLVFVIFGTIFLFIMESGESLLLNRFSIALETLSFIISNPNFLLIEGMDGSTLARFTSIFVCFGNWLDNPLLGLGAGITKAHDFTVTMLVGNGIIGCMAWYYFITATVNGRKQYDHLLLLTIFCIEFFPTGPGTGWYTYFYFVFLAEVTSLYCKGRNI